MSKFGDYNFIDIKLSYIAGLFDGDGCVSFQASKGSLAPYLRINISNSCRFVLEFVVNTLHKGTVRLIYPATTKRKPMYVWACRSKEAAEVLERIFPYLIIKREQAMVGVELAWALPARRFELVAVLRALNSAGRKEVENANLSSKVPQM